MLAISANVVAFEKSKPCTSVTVPSIVNFKEPSETDAKLETLEDKFAVVTVPDVALTPPKGNTYNIPPPVQKLGTGVNKARAILKVNDDVPKSASTADGVI